MWPLLAAVPQLLTLGQQIYEAVAGKPSQAQTAPALQAEVAALPAEQQKAFTEQMQVALQQYQAETDRLKVEEGDMDATTLTAIGPDAAKQVALLRMTTRPWTVRRMVHMMLLPFYVTIYDMAMVVLNNIIVLCGSDKKLTLLGSMFFNEKSLYREMYDSGVGPAALIVVTYMTLRAVDKAQCGGSSIGQQIGGLVSSVASMFKRK